MIAEKVNFFSSLINTPKRIEKKKYMPIWAYINGEIKKYEKGCLNKPVSSRTRPNEPRSINGNDEIKNFVSTIIPNFSKNKYKPYIAAIKPVAYMPSEMIVYPSLASMPWWLTGWFTASAIIGPTKYFHIKLS